jgi:general stress protein 26
MKEQTGLEKLWDLVKDVRIAMLTTQDEKGELHSRPMGAQEKDFEGDLWFFTSLDSRKSVEIQDNQKVNLCYMDTGKNLYVSVSGTAAVVRDAQKAQQLWSPLLKAWFPNGPTDPTVALIKVTVNEAEYWEGPSSKVVQLVKIFKAAATGTTPDLGKNERIKVS